MASLRLLLLFSSAFLALSLGASSSPSTSSLQEGLHALLYIPGWLVSAGFYCEDKLEADREACEEQFVLKKTPPAVADEDAQLDKSLPHRASGAIDYWAIKEQWMACGKNGTIDDTTLACLLPSGCATYAIALEQLFRARSSTFRKNMDNDIIGESLEPVIKAQHAVGSIAVEFIIRLQHLCPDDVTVEGAKTQKDAVNICLRTFMPKAVDNEHKGVAEKIDVDELRELFTVTLKEWEECKMNCESAGGCEIKPNCAYYAIAFEVFLTERDNKYAKYVEEREERARKESQ